MSKNTKHTALSRQEKRHESSTALSNIFIISSNTFREYFCGFCAGFTKERIIERASSSYWTEPPLPEAFHRVSRAARHLERQVAFPPIFPAGPGPRETAEQH